MLTPLAAPPPQKPRPPPSPSSPLRTLSPLNLLPNLLRFLHRLCLRPVPPALHVWCPPLDLLAPYLEGFGGGEGEGAGTDRVQHVSIEEDVTELAL